MATSSMATAMLTSNPRLTSFRRPQMARPITALDSLSSQFMGLRIAPPKPKLTSTVSAPSRRTFHIVAHRVCPFTGKRPNRKNIVSFSNKKTKSVQNINMITKRLWWEEGNRFVKIKLSAKGLRTVEKYGLGFMCKKVGIDLRKNIYQ